MNKKIIALGMSLLLITAPVTVLAQQSVSKEVAIKVNGYKIQMYEAPAYIDAKSNLTYVPLRFVSEALGAEIKYVNAKTPITTSIDKPIHHEAKVLLDSKKAEIDGKVKTIEGAPKLNNGRTMVPLRVISEGLGANVKWVPNKVGGGTVEINTSWKTPKPVQSGLPWNPDKIQKEYAQKVFKEFKWNDSTRTLRFNIPKMEGVNPLIAIKYGTTETPITLGKDYTFKNLPAEFKIYVTIFSDSSFTSLVDNYTIMSYGYANNHKWADGLSSKDLVVKDQYEKNISLTTVQRVLGISK